MRLNSFCEGQAVSKETVSGSVVWDGGYSPYRALRIQYIAMSIASQKAAAPWVQFRNWITIVVFSSARRQKVDKPLGVVSFRKSCLQPWMEVSKYIVEPALKFVALGELVGHETGFHR